MGRHLARPNEVLAFFGDCDPILRHFRHCRTTRGAFSARLNHKCLANTSQRLSCCARARAWDEPRLGISKTVAQSFGVFITAKPRLRPLQHGQITPSALSLPGHTFFSTAEQCVWPSQRGRVNPVFSPAESPLAPLHYTEEALLGLISTAQTRSRAFQHGANHALGVLSMTEQRDYFLSTP